MVSTGDCFLGGCESSRMKHMLGEWRWVCKRLTLGYKPTILTRCAGIACVWARMWWSWPAAA